VGLFFFFFLKKDADHMSLWHSLFYLEMFSFWAAQKNVLWIIAWHTFSLKLPCCTWVIKYNTWVINSNSVWFVGTSRII